MRLPMLFGLVAKCPRTNIGDCLGLQASCPVFLGKKKPINIKNFGGTPSGVRPVCPGDTSRLSRDMSRLSRGRSVPLVLIYT